MKSLLFKILELVGGTKWFVIAETTYNDMDYKYLIKVTDDEEDFTDEFNLIKFMIIDEKEYVGPVTDDKEREAVMLKIMPEIKPLIDNKTKILEELQKLQ